MTWSELSERASRVMQSKSEWAGVPIPLDGFALVLEPRFPYQRVCRTSDVDECPDEPEFEEINLWWSNRLQADVVVIQERGKETRTAIKLPFDRWKLAVKTIGASVVWPVDAEIKAMEKLAGLISNHAGRCYMLTGSFLETSSRSGVTYMFRRSRPTLAVRPDGDGGTKVIAGLCQHPIGFYSESWAGVMCPTDEVIANLLMARGDEHLLWKRCNQHSADHPLCGL